MVIEGMELPEEATSPPGDVGSMAVVRVRNVCNALPAGLDLLVSRGQEQASRAGPVIVAPYPVMTIYTHPWERVLFHPARDANPFFHLFEALWMLAGRNDASFLNLFVRDFGERFAEPDGSVHGAYGHRWRQHFYTDQIGLVVNRLRANPDDRQCVITMWDPTPEYVQYSDYTGADDMNPAQPWKDRPCNTHIYLLCRPAYRDLDEASWDSPTGRVLEMTVCCRSNDIIWGAYGANAVHFSVLQEYLAAKIGVAPGRLFQLSNNYHAYVDELGRIAKRAGTDLGGEAMLDDRYYTDTAEPHQLVDSPATFDAELGELLRLMEHGDCRAISHNGFLARTALVMAMAHRRWRDGKKQEALLAAQKIAAPDWRMACTEWMERRLDRN
jgi:hypothetical protein